MHTNMKKHIKEEMQGFGVSKILNAERIYLFYSGSNGKVSLIGM